MDFDSLSISKISNTDSGSQSSSYITEYMSNYSSVRKTDESTKNASDSSARTSDENLKANSYELSQKTDNKKVADEKKDDSNLKGNYIEDMERAIKIANEKLKNTNKQFSYSIHEATKQVMISIKDSDGNVIKEIPSEESLDFYAKLQELSGMLLDAKR